MTIDERRKIEELHRKDRAASLAKDYLTLLSLMDEDIILIPPKGEPQRGIGAVSQNLKAYFDESEGGDVLEYDQDFEEVVVSGDMAFDWGDFRGREVLPTGGEVRQSARFMRILKRQIDGTWKVFRTLWVGEEIPDETAAADEIRRIIRAINEAWTQKKTEDLDAFFDDRIMIVAPNLHVLGRGKEACLASYADFAGRARIRRFSADVPEISIWGDTAVAGYSFEIDWEEMGRERKDAGREVFVFQRAAGRWLAVWRLVLPQDTGQDEA